MRQRFLILCCGFAVLYAQDKPVQTPTAQPDVKPNTKPAVRRFSAGGILSFSGFQLMENKSLTEATTATKSTVSTTTPKGQRFGGGAFVQVALDKHFAVTASALLRRVSFETNNDTTEGTKVSKQNDFSSADFLEFPILLRRYSKSRYEEGARWYGEGGLALRRVRNVRSSLQNTAIDGKVTCCDERPVAVANRFATGFTVGGGYQFIDQFGLRFIPGIRYTRWTQGTFDNRSVRSNRNQLEAIIAITF